MGISLFINTNGFQHLDFSDFVYDSLAGPDTSVTMCGLPISPFDCSRIRLRHVDTQTELIDALLDSLSRNNTSVLFVASLTVLRTILHRVAYLKTVYAGEIKLVVGTTPEFVTKLTPACKAADVLLRSTRRIKVDQCNQTTLCFGSLMKQFQFHALMAQKRCKEDRAQKRAETHQLTKGATLYSVKADIGWFLLLVFTHADLAWDAYSATHLWWPWRVDWPTSPRFQGLKDTHVLVRRVSKCEVAQVDVESDDVDDSIIQFMP